MALEVKHKFFSGVQPDPDPSLVNTNEWNDLHKVEGILGTDQGGLGVAVVDPNEDAILFWDDSAGTFRWLKPGTNVSIYEDRLNVDVVVDHGDLTGLGHDDHPQYHNDARGDARYVPATHSGSGGLAHATATALVNGFMSASDKARLDAFTNEHGDLIGLSDDDHPQYHNDARGDLRYAPLNHVGAGDAAHSIATQASNGFMAASDKIKLDKLAAAVPAPIFKFNFYNAATPPASGRLNVENTGGQTRVFRINKTDADGVVRNFAPMLPGDNITITDDPATPPISGFARYLVTSDIVDNGGYWTVSVTRTDIAGAATVADGTRIRFIPTMSAGSGGAGGATDASLVTLTPVGGVQATDVQGGIQELDAEKSNIVTTVTKDSATGAAHMPVGSTAQRPVAPLYGDTRINSETGQPEWWNDEGWMPMAGGFEAGVVIPFAMAAAPVGWVQITDDGADNRMLRVVKDGSGAATGGSHSPILNNVVPAHTHGFTTGNVSADHTHWTQTGGRSADHSHGIGDPGHAHTELAMLVGAGGSYYAGCQGGYQGSYAVQASGTGIYTGGANADHSHAGTSGGISANHVHSGGTDNGSSSTNWTPRYINLILCAKQ